MSVVKIAALSLTVLFLLVAVVRLFHRPLRLALRTGDGADAGRQLVQCADGRGAGSAGAGAAASGEVGAGVGT